MSGSATAIRDRGSHFFSEKKYKEALAAFSDAIVSRIIYSLFSLYRDKIILA